MTWTVPATVLRVVDGDTLQVELDLGWHLSLKVMIRLSGVDTPEMRTLLGRQAKAYVEALLPVGSKITVISNELDKYGRTLATVITPLGDNLTELLIRDGVGRPYSGGTRTPFPTPAPAVETAPQPVRADYDLAKGATPEE